MLSDTFPVEPYQTGDQLTSAITITMDGPVQAKKIFENLQEVGEVLMPFQETFWSPFYVQVKVKFAITRKVQQRWKNRNEFLPKAPPATAAWCFLL